MTRFWTRFIRTFRKEKENKKKLPSAVVFDEYVTPPSYLKESHLYGHHLVKIEKLERAYNNLLLLQQQQKKKSSYWKTMEPFIQTWYSELERVCHQSKSALVVLQVQLEDVSHILRAVSSPHKNQDRKSLRKAQQFISSCIQNLDSGFSRASAITFNESQSLASALIVSRTESSYMQSSFSGTTTIESELRDSQFQTFYHDVEERIQKEIESNKSNPRLRQCIRQVYRLEQDLYLHNHYITSQFSILWDLGNIFLGSLVDNEEEEPNLYHAMKMKWQQQFNNQLKPYQDLEANFKKLLKCSTPNREDFTCAVCLSILHEPIVLAGCDHTFCKSCIQQMYCKSCHTHRARTVNRISENLGVLLMKPIPAVVNCTCQVINPISGEPVPKNQHKAKCPLCRSPFKPDQCSVDIALEKFISFYFPKRENDDEDDEVMHGEAEKKNKIGRIVNMGKSKKSLAEEKKGENDSRRRRRSQVDFDRFYSKMQRWSYNKRTQQNNSDSANTSNSYSRYYNNYIPPVPPISASYRQENDMLLLTRQSWIF